MALSKWSLRAARFSLVVGLLAGFVTVFQDIKHHNLWGIEVERRNEVYRCAGRLSDEALMILPKSQGFAGGLDLTGVCADRDEGVWMSQIEDARLGILPHENGVPRIRPQHIMENAIGSGLLSLVLCLVGILLGKIARWVWS